MVKGYMQVPVVDYIESFSPVATDTQTRIMIGITSCHNEEVWVAKLCDMEAALLHPYAPVDMFIELNKGILDLGIITKGIYGRILHPIRKFIVWGCQRVYLMVDIAS